MILAGDLGGTKTILALYQQHGTALHCVKKETFASADFADFAILLQQFLVSEKTATLDRVCLGVAGPIVDGNCIITNLPWILNRQALTMQAKTRKVYLLNDLEATAWGVLMLSANDFVQLNPHAKVNKGNIALLAAGTGLGEAVVISSDNKYHVLATEGGHSDFAPRNELEIGLLRYLLTLYPNHVSYERVLCGQGLVNIYHYLQSIEFAPTNPTIALRMSKQDPATVIAEQGAVETQGLCVKSLQLFCAIYGAEAGNLALKCLPQGGIILAGGIAIKNLSALEKGDFLCAYLAKGRYTTTLQDFSIKVCLNAEVALIGAANFALGQ